MPTRFQPPIHPILEREERFCQHYSDRFTQFKPLHLVYVVVPQTFDACVLG
jgi:hypothetical protein